MRSVVIDIGGVIFPDIWETIFLHPEEGIIKYANIEKSLKENKLKYLWDKYAIFAPVNNDWKKTEIDYWTEIKEILNIDLSVDLLINKSIEVIKPYKNVEDVIIKRIINYNETVVCSNQSSFWFERQLLVSDVLKVIPRDKMVLSFECGMTKEEKPYEMFNIAEKKCNNKGINILYIDDREINIEHAKKYGFEANKFLYENEYSIKKLENILDKYL